MGAIDLNKVLRDACILALSDHIRARLVQTGCVLARGSAEGQARYLIGRWNDASVRMFYILASADGRFFSHSKLAKEAGAKQSASESFWGTTLKGMRVAARVADTPNRQDIKLFRRGHEMFWSQHGIKLQIKASMLNFDLSRTITDTTIEQTLASQQNYEGACRAQEADASRPEAERSAGRDRINAELTKPEVVSNQGRLFGTDGTVGNDA
jgi:hypothetical protein